MNNYQTNAQSRTSSTIKLGCIFLLSPLLAHPINSDDSHNYMAALNIYQLGQIPNTYGQYTNPVTGSFALNPESDVDIFETKIADFYKKLTTSQENLGTELSKVLFDNLWDLYEA